MKSISLNKSKATLEEKRAEMYIETHANPAHSRSHHKSKTSLEQDNTKSKTPS